MTYYFDLAYMRTYTTGGIGGVNGKKYYFEKDKPTLVEDAADASLFRGQPEIFIELDNQLNRVIPAPEAANENRTYRRYREANILPENAEDLLNKVLSEAQVNPPQRDVSDLLKAANVDSLIPIPATVQDTTIQETHEDGENLGTIMSEDVSQRPSVKKEKKVAPNTCPKCNRKFKSNTELENHLADHEDGE